MELQSLLHADYLDIVFDHRNKLYGGYELRRHYQHRIHRALLIVLFSTLTLSIYVTLANHHKTGDKLFDTQAVVHISDIEPPKPPITIIPPTPPAAAPHVKTEIFTPPKIVTDDIVKPDDHLAEAKDLKNVQISNARHDGPASDLDPGLTSSSSGTAVIEKQEPAKPFLAVQQMPEFNGDINNYLSSNLLYPASARETNIEGKVIIQFIVNEDGAITDARILKGIGGGCDEEALRVVKNMPKWKAGKQNGRTVKVFFTLPIRFMLQN